MGTLHWSRTCSKVSTFDFVRSAASETALRRTLFPPKMMNCLEGLTLCSSGAARRVLEEQSRPKLNKLTTRMATVTQASNASPARTLWGRRAPCRLIAKARNRRKDSTY